MGNVMEKGGLDLSYMRFGRRTKGYLLSSKWKTFSGGNLIAICQNRETYGGTIGDSSSNAHGSAEWEERHDSLLWPFLPARLTVSPNGVGDGGIGFDYSQECLYSE